jgi:uncharacterized protein YjbJ (UPF0337 family)
MQIREATMNSDQLQGKWKQVTGKVKEKWGKLTNDDLDVIQGRQDQLVGKIQERYGIVKEEAEKQVNEFVTTLGSTDSADYTVTTDTKASRAGRS